jgi:tetratricopeptide (TPR) repeat protein
MRKTSPFLSLLRNVLLILVVGTTFSCDRKPAKVNPGQTTSGDSINIELIRLTNDVVRNPKSVKPLLARAGYYVNQEMFNEALQDVNKALALDVKDSEVYVTLSDVYLYSGKIQRALDALKKAAALSPGNAEIDVKTARIFLTMSDYKQTFNYLREALKKDPENAEAFFISGLANEEMGDTIKAIDSYQNAVARDKRQYDALKQLGILFSIKKDKLAVDYLRNASQIRPDKPEPLYILGMFYQDNGEPDKSLSVYNEIIQIDSSYKLAWYNRGYVFLVYKQDYHKAIESFNKVLQLDQDYSDALYNRGYAFELLGDYKSARKDYEQVLRMVTNNNRAILGLNRLDALGN